MCMRCTPPNPRMPIAGLSHVCVCSLLLATYGARCKISLLFPRLLHRLACPMLMEGDTVSVVTGAGDRETEANTEGPAFTAEQLAMIDQIVAARVAASTSTSSTGIPMSHVPVASSTLSFSSSGKLAPSNYRCLVIGPPPGAADRQRRSLPPLLFSPRLISLS